MNFVLLCLAAFLPLPLQPPASPDVAVTIATVDRTKHAVALDQSGVSFYVALENRTEKPLTLLQENCSWGYEMLEFEAVDAAGNKYVLRKAPRAWYKNVPNPLLLASGEMALRGIEFGSGTWVGLPPLASGKTMTLKLRAILHIGAEEFLSRENIWAGRAVSKWTTLTLTRS